jgi:very-short-patch-repair endonuclease
LRRNLTDAERILWHELRAHRLSGLAFRRQTPIGPYIVDFVSHQAHLIVEIDGGQHFHAEELERDKRRDSFLRKKGYRVLRFSNLDVLKNKAGVLDIIVEVAAPSLTLPRKRGREKPERIKS